MRFVMKLWARAAPSLPRPSVGAIGGAIEFVALFDAFLRFIFQFFMLNVLPRDRPAAIFLCKLSAVMVVSKKCFFMATASTADCICIIDRTFTSN